MLEITIIFKIKKVTYFIHQRNRGNSAKIYLIINYNHSLYFNMILSCFIYLESYNPFACMYIYMYDIRTMRSYHDKLRV